MTETDSRPPSPELALWLVKISMPPFEKFLDHCTTLKAECSKAGKLTPEREKLFADYHQALLDGREEYEHLIAGFIRDSFTEHEVLHLLAFYTSPVLKILEKSQALASTVSAITTGWQTRVLERCPEVWQMIIGDVGEWQEKNTPEGSSVALPETPNEASAWKQVEDALASPEEDAEIEALRQA